MSSSAFARAYPGVCCGERGNIEFHELENARRWDLPSQRALTFEGQPLLSSDSRGVIPEYDDGEGLKIEIASRSGIGTSTHEALTKPDRILPKNSGLKADWRGKTRFR
jgi:hypothetical protein